MARKVPQLFTAMEIFKSDTSVCGKDRIYRPARYLKRNIRFPRIRLALGVLVGRYDALDWESSK